MAITLTVDASTLPGASDVLSKIDGIRSDFMALPARILRVQQILSQAIPEMGHIGVPSSVLSQANELLQTAAQYRSQWDAASADFSSVDAAVQTGNILNVSTIAEAIQLATTFATLGSNVSSLESQVVALVQQYTPDVSVSLATGGGNTMLYLLGGALVLYMVLRR